MSRTLSFFFFFFFNDTATTEIYTLSLHDALPISPVGAERAEHDRRRHARGPEEHHRAPWPRPPACELSGDGPDAQRGRSEEHTSELQSQSNLVCRLLLEKKKIINLTYLHQ